MEHKFDSFLRKYSMETRERFAEQEALKMKSTTQEIKCILWSRIPSFYVGESFIRLIPFSDHINIQANAIQNYIDKLLSYTLTPKGMIKLNNNEVIDPQLFMQVFNECLTEE